MEDDNIKDKQESPPVKKLVDVRPSDSTLHPEEWQSIVSHAQEEYEKFLSEMSDNLTRAKEEILTKAEQIVNEIKEKMKPIETSEVRSDKTPNQKEEPNPSSKSVAKDTPQPKSEVSFEELFYTGWQWLSAQWRNYLQSYLIVVIIAFTALFGCIAVKFQKDKAQLMAEKHRIELVDEKYRTLRHWAEHDRSWRKRFLIVDQMYSDTVYYRDDIRDLQNHISRLDSLTKSNK